MPVRNINELGRSSYTQGGYDYVQDRGRLMGAGFGEAPFDLSLGRVRSVAAAATGVKSDGLIIFTGTSTYTFTLPAAATWAGSVMKFKKTGASGTVTIDGNASETIDGAANYALDSQYEFVELYSDGTNVHILSRHVIT